MLAQNNYFIYNAFIVNEGKIFQGDVLIQHGIIKGIYKEKSPVEDILMENDTMFVDASGRYLIPGVIDTHVHFREPGLTHKGCFLSESKAAVAGGVTSVMDMPNVIPQTTSCATWEERMQLAKDKMYTNYSFYIAATDANSDEIKALDKHKVCGIKLFLGSSTGNMLIADNHVLENLLQTHTVPLVAHCEDEAMIHANIEQMKATYGEHIPIEKHPVIRSAEACYLSTEKIINLAKKHHSQIHILHVSTTDELALFTSDYPEITAEVCVAYLFLDDTQYASKGTSMKCNPAIKTKEDKKALLQALNNGIAYSIASDHAPHTLEEKNNTYLKAPSGMPGVQHILPLMLEFYFTKEMKLQTIVEKMCHAPARLFQIENRGFIKEDFQADLVLLDLDKTSSIAKDSLYYQCRWSPFEGMLLHSSIEKTFVNGEMVYDQGDFAPKPSGKPLYFKR
ncbi:MAG: dihydroorotase [Bacteroidales bacterium]|jgi:dihydroorotase|nr:dihydroorotase [Bacteroidales bacterium]MDD2688207.1 dihydroorotase [Bacteroidales bacterium]MDD3330352.1 dihydroorotase [Bacteroidales bacterium]MDD3690758.1 dihydroorotase [Bacteroidales bacterium]MDD4044293.1 dihydroorotase [Bacteroidales bacterium]